MTKNNLNFDIINAVNSQVSSFVYLYEENKLSNELNYLSQGLTKGSSEETQIIFTKFFNNPFLIFTSSKNQLSEDKLINALSSFYQSNSQAPKKLIWIDQSHKSLKDKISKDLGLEIRTIDS